MHTPPLGATLSCTVEARGARLRARVRWREPDTRRQVGRYRLVNDKDGAEDFFESMRIAASTGLDPGIKVGDYLQLIGNRWMRGIDLSSTADPYRAGMVKRVVPAFGHLPVTMLTAGLIDRTVDGWEKSHSASTLKCTLAALTRLLDEAVRDDLIKVNPARLRARRSWSRTVQGSSESPRSHAIPDLDTLIRLVDAITGVHRSYGDHVTLCALLAARGSEVAGLDCGDVDLAAGVVHIRRQVYPGAGGLITKPTKGRRTRVVPILDPLRPVLERLTAGRGSTAALVRGPRGGVITTAALRRATHWDEMVGRFGLVGLRRHGLRHTGATWLADAGVPLHVLQDILGHQSLETTRGYLHTDYRHLTAAAAAANSYLGVRSTQSAKEKSTSLKVVK